MMLIRSLEHNSNVLRSLVEELKGISEAIIKYPSAFEEMKSNFLN